MPGFDLDTAGVGKRTLCADHTHGTCKLGYRCRYSHTLVDVRRLERLLGSESTRDPNDTLTVDYRGHFSSGDESWGEGWDITVKRRQQAQGRIRHEVLFAVAGLDPSEGITELERADIGLDTLLSPTVSPVSDNAAATYALNSMAIVQEGGRPVLCLAYAGSGECRDPGCRDSHSLFDIARLAALVGTPASTNGEQDVFASLEYRMQYSSWKWHARVFANTVDGQLSLLKRPTECFSINITKALINLERKVNTGKRDLRNCKRPSRGNSKCLCADRLKHSNMSLQTCLERAV
jgi:hypothetical protein